MKRRRTRRHRRRISPCRTHYTQQNICVTYPQTSSSLIEKRLILMAESEMITILNRTSSLCLSKKKEEHFEEYLSPGGEMLRVRSRVRLRFVFAEPG